MFCLHNNGGKLVSKLLAGKLVISSMTYRLKSLDVAPEGCGYFYLQILLSWIVLVNPYNTFEYQSISKYFDRTLVKYSPIQVSSLYLCQQGQKMVWTISECSKILAMKIPGAENPRAEMSPCRNVHVPKSPRAEKSLCRNVHVPKNPRAETRTCRKVW